MYLKLISEKRKKKSHLNIYISLLRKGKLEFLTCTPKGFVCSMNSSMLFLQLIGLWQNTTVILKGSILYILIYISKEDIKSPCWGLFFFFFFIRHLKPFIKLYLFPFSSQYNYNGKLKLPSLRVFMIWN